MKKIEEAEKREEEAKKREEEFAQKLARQMKIHGASIEEIKKETGLSAEEIAGLMG